jgi:uncharacterized protein (TIGR02271 family)
MAQTVIGVFDSSSEAQNAVDKLVSNGFSRSNIDISSKSGSSSYNKADRDGDGDVDFGDKVGSFFSSLFGGDEADRYSRVASQGYIVTVHTQSMQEAERAADILDEYGSVDVNDRAIKLGYGSSTSGGYSATSGLDTDRSFRDRDVTDADKSIPIIEENLQVGKREVTTGGVRLRSRIIERPVEEHIRLREEHVTVERNPVNRPASAADLANFQEGTIEVTEHAEQAMVNKEARIVEEVRLNKEVTERDEVIRDTVRRTDVDIENISSTDRLDSDRLDLDNDRNRRLDSDDLNRSAGL